MKNKHRFIYYICISLLSFSYIPSYAQKWVDMGTKADNGAPMYWSSYDFIQNKKSEWELAKTDTLIGAETTWSLENNSYTPIDIGGKENYDIATKSLSKPYRIPSQREWDRLLSNCDVSYYCVKVKNSRIIPYEPDIRDMSWLYGSWSLMSGGVYMTVIIDKNQLIFRSFIPGVEALPHEDYRGSYTIYMNRIKFMNDKATLGLDIIKRELYSADGHRFKNEHFVRRGPTQIPAKWIDYMQLKSRINGNTLVFPLVKYSSDDEYNAMATESPYLSSHSESICWWSSTSANDGDKYIMKVNGSGEQIQTASSWKKCRIRPVYDDGHKNPSKYPNDFGWLQVDVDRFAEGQLNIYLDDSLIGNAPYHKELKVSCGTHKVRITGDRIKELERNVSVGYRETCNYHPSIISKYAKVTIHSSECEIQIDGKRVGSFSWSGELEAGIYTVKVTKACYEPYQEIITIVGGRDDTFEITPYRLKKHAFTVSCNADSCKVTIDGQTSSLNSVKPLSQSLEMKMTHTLSVESPGFVPIEIKFSIQELGVVFQSRQELGYYDGEQSSVEIVESGGLNFHLSKLNKQLYYGNNAQYKQRPNYDGPNMGIDRIIIHGMSIGSEIGYIGELYGKSRVLLSWSAGLALRPGEDDTSLLFFEETKFEMPVEYYVGLGIGWQIFRGTGFRVTPQIGATGCSLFDEPYVTLCAKINVSYPLTDRFIIGVTPMINLFKIEELSNPYFYWNPSFGISLTLGWQR